jgi:hypothetical protein
MSTSAARIALLWGSAAVLIASPVGAAPSASTAASPAGATPPAGAATSPASPAPATPTPPAAPLDVGTSRSSIERGMTELGTLLTRARQSGDTVRIACVQDKRDRAEIVLEVATGEILVLQDPGADGQTRAFAGEKLSEAAGRLSGLVGQARACQGGGEEAQGGGQNASTQPKTVIPLDPTSTVPTGPRLPPRIDPRPPVASAVL